MINVSIQNTVGEEIISVEVDGRERLPLMAQAVHQAVQTGIDLSSANLEAVDLTRSVMDGARLVNAQLSRSNLQHASLRGANLEHAQLWTANINQADLSGANLRNACLDAVSAAKANLSNADLGKSAMLHASLWAADLRGANLEGANLQGANLSQANLRGANLCGADLSRCDLTGADLFGANITGVRLSKCTGLTGAQLESAKRDPEAGLRQQAIAALLANGGHFGELLDVRPVEVSVSQFNFDNFLHSRLAGAPEWKQDAVHGMIFAKMNDLRPAFKAARP